MENKLSLKKCMDLLGADYTLMKYLDTYKSAKIREFFDVSFFSYPLTNAQWTEFRVMTDIVGKNFKYWKSVSNKKLLDAVQVEAMLWLVAFLQNFETREKDIVDRLSFISLNITTNIERQIRVFLENGDLDTTEVVFKTKLNTEKTFTTKIPWYTDEKAKVNFRAFRLALDASLGLDTNLDVQLISENSIYRLLKGNDCNFPGIAKATFGIYEFLLIREHLMSKKSVLQKISRHGELNLEFEKWCQAQTIVYLNTKLIA